MANNETTTKFKVDISDLKKAMQTARKEVALANSEFKAVSSSMDSWGKSSDGIKAKLKQLDGNLKSQKTVLAEYEKTLEEVKAQYGENSTQAMEYQTKLNNQKAVVNNTEKQIAQYSEALDRAEKAEKIASMTGRDATEVFDELGEEAKGAGKSAESASGGFSVMKGALADLVADGIRLAADALKDFASSMIDTAATVKAEQSKFSQTFGDLEDDATAAIKNIADTTGILDTRLKDTGANIYAFARSSGASTDEAMELMQTALMATADSAAYYDRSLEDSAETLQSFLKGNFANDAALGVSATEFTRNAKATELFGKKYNDLTEIQKQQTLLKMVTDAQEIAGAMGQASREADGWENVQGNLNEAWRQFQANVGAPFLEALIPIVQDITASFKEWSDSVDWEAFGEKVKSVAEVIKTGFKWILDNKDAIIAGLAGIAAGFLAFKVVTLIQEVRKAMEGMTLAQYALNLAMNLNPIGLMAAAIAVLVAAFVLLWNKSEAFRNFWIGLWEEIKAEFDVVWNGIVKFFTETIPNAFNSVINWIKSNWTTLLTFLINPFAGLFKYFYENNSKFREFVDNAVSAIKELPAKVWTWLQDTINKVTQWANNLAQKGKQAAKSLLDAVVNGIKSLPDKVKSIGNNLVEGLWNGINDKVGWIKSKLSGFKDSVMNALKDFFGIHSPSKLMEEEIGKWLPAGIAVGIDKNAKTVMSSLRDLTADAVGSARVGLTSASGGLSSSGVGGVVNNFTQINNSPKALSRLEIYRQSKNLLGYAGGI